MKKRMKFFITFLSTVLLCSSVTLTQKNTINASDELSKAEETAIVEKNNSDKPAQPSAKPAEVPAKAKNKSSQLFLPLFDENADEVTDDLTIEFKSANHTVTSKTDDGEIGAKLFTEVSYTVRLLDNPKYTMEPFNITIKNGAPYRDDNGELLFNLDLKKKVEQPKPAIKRSTLYLAVLEGKDESSADVTFEFKSNDETITSKNDDGQVGARLLNDVSYTVSLKDNDKYTFNSFSFTLKNGTPYRDDNGELLVSLDLKKKAEQPKPAIKRTTLYLAVLEGKDESSADVTFKFKGNDETITSKNDDGQVGARLLNDVSYTVSLKDNDKYTFNSFSFTLKNGTPYRDDNGELLVSLDITKKVNDTEKPDPNTPPTKPGTDKPKDPNDCGCDDPNQQKVTIKQLKIVDIKDPEGETIKEPLTFVFFNVSKQKPAGEYTSKDGKLPPVEMLVDDEYEVYLKENDHYGMRHRHFYAFMNHYPIDMDDENERYADRLELIKKDKDYVEPKQPAVKAIMQVRYKGKIIKDPVTFEFVSKGETVRATSVDGIVTVNLRESVDYMVGVVDNDKYTIETFPIVIKNKQVGKFPYDHRTCWLVEYLDLVDKGSISTENPHYTIATEDEKVRISGMNFKDLKLQVTTVDPKTIPALKGMDALVYDINFINIYRNEIVKLKGDFTVTVPKERGRKVKAIYYINEFGQLEKRNPIAGEFNSVITFKTDHFSRYAIVYEDKVTPDDNANNNAGNDNNATGSDNTGNNNGNDNTGNNNTGNDNNGNNNTGNNNTGNDNNGNNNTGNNNTGNDNTGNDNGKNNNGKNNNSANNGKDGQTYIQQPSDNNIPAGSIDELKNNTNSTLAPTNKDAKKLPNTGNSTTNTTFAGILLLLGAIAVRRVRR